MTKRKAPEGPRPRGRPTRYSAKLAERILARLIDGQSLREICRDKGLPAESTVRLWAVSDIDGFSARYTQAREAQMDRFAEEIIEIADDGTNDWIERQLNDGRTETAPDHEHITRSRLRVDTRKWLMSKLAPKRYGERMELEHSGPGGGPIETRELSARDVLAGKLARLAERGGTDDDLEKPDGAPG